MNLRFLQNGSDIRGVALDGVKGENVNFTEETAVLLGKSFSQWVSIHIKTAKDAPVIGIGTDSRISGPQIKKSFIEGLVSEGAKVIDMGMATTPAMFMATQFSEFNCDGAVMVTASHLPPNRNGLKFFTKNGGLEKSNISQILDIAETNKFANTSSGSVKNSNVIAPYSAHIINYIRNKTGQETPLANLKIIVDAGNGAGGFFASEILKPLGANTEGSQFLSPDGNFPNHVPNPEDKDAMESICKAVLKYKADLGVIFDTDVDRAAIVDKNGNPINRNRLIALLSAIVLNQHPGSTIVTDSVTSAGLAKFIEAKGGVHHRFRRGYKNVINESVRLNNDGIESWLAIETSGHGAFRENYFLDDGAFIVAKVLVELARLNEKGQNITDHLSGLEEPEEAAEFRIKISGTDFQEIGKTVIQGLQEFVLTQPDWQAEEVNYEGYRVNCTSENEQGWFLLRMSLHDPVLPLNIETNISGGIHEISNRLIDFLKQFDRLDINCLTEK